jgi:hypothetical protein
MFFPLLDNIKYLETVSIARHDNCHMEDYYTEKERKPDQEKAIKK